MAKVILSENRELESGYHVYKQPSASGPPILVRRKMAIPSDVEHRSSRSTQEQRKRLAVASRRYSLLPFFVKQDLRKEFAWVWRHHSPSLSEPVLLQGRQLFISQDIHAQQYHDGHVETPPWSCCLAVSHAPGRALYPWTPGTRVLPYYYKLACFKGSRWTSYPGTPLLPGSTLFYPLPEGYDFFRPTSDEWLYCSFPHHDETYDYLIHEPFIITFPKIRIWQTSFPPLLIVTTQPETDYWPVTDPDILWKFNMHERYGTGEGNYYPEPAFTFTITHPEPNRLKINIHPVYVRKNSEISTLMPSGEILYWTVTAQGGGWCTLDPDKKNLYIYKNTGKIIKYED